MKAIMLSLSLLLMTHFAQGHWKTFDSSLLTDEALIAKIEAIADELEANNHNQEIMNMTFNRSRVIRRKLNWFAPYVGRISDATDDDIMPLLQDIVSSLESYSHFKLTLYKVNHHLDTILTKLIDNREAPTEIAVLSFVETGILDFGVIFFGNVGTRILSITNSGNGEATDINEVNLVAPFGVQANASSCQDTLAAGETCTIILEYAPTVSGLTETDVVIEYNDGTAIQSINFPIRGRAI